MSTIADHALAFFDACGTGRGWDGCAAFRHADATFPRRGETFGGRRTVHEYVEAMKGMIAGPLPDAAYEIRSFAVDDARRSVAGFAVFSAPHAGVGGPLPPAGRRVETGFVHVMEFDGDRIRHVTKVWNDGFAMRRAGGA